MVTTIKDWYNYTIDDKEREIADCIESCMYVSGGPWIFTSAVPWRNNLILIFNRHT